MYLVVGGDGGDNGDGRSSSCVGEEASSSVGLSRASCRLSGGTGRADGGTKYAWIDGRQSAAASRSAAVFIMYPCIVYQASSDIMVSGLGADNALVPLRYSVNGVSRCIRKDGRTLVDGSSITGESWISLTGRPLT
jgi:hypothetical protein